MVLKKSGARTAAEFLAVVILLIAAMMLITSLFNGKGEKTDPVGADDEIVVIVDAGHGGMDGGAVGADGTQEKHINLAVAEILSDLLTVSGYKTVMTRTEDVMLTTEDGAGSAKMQDLKQRLNISSKYPDALTVSVHCNKFPLESCRGMQVYYSDSDAARQTAERIQYSSRLLQTYNKREIKKADSSIYLLHRAKYPGVLVECGFLSNAEELQALKTEEYQKQLALVILKGINESYGARSEASLGGKA